VTEFGFSSLLSRIAGKAGGKQQKPEYTRVEPAVALSTSPRILLGLFRKMYRYSLENEITHWYASMERTLARMLARMHFAFNPISSQVDYYGPVSLYLVSIADLEKTCRRKIQRCWPGFVRARATIRHSCKTSWVVKGD
jgi:N-acyl amino acid synthase of PEP-CTERM/exosortase system